MLTLAIVTGGSRAQGQRFWLGDWTGTSMGSPAELRSSRRPDRSAFVGVNPRV